MAASRRVDGPFAALAEITFPFSSITTSTVTTPEVRMRLAVSGYIGGGKKVAAPFNTPPDTGLKIGFGAEVGGGSESSTTLGELVEGPVFLTSTGVPALSLSPLIEAAGTD